MSFVIQNVSSLTANTTQDFCRKYSGGYPSFTPIINGLSVTTCSKGVYTLVYVYGTNFLPNNTYINFGSFTNLSVIFYNSFTISFVVPSKAGAGSYNVVAINKYNGNFSPSINSSYSGNLCYSNLVTFTIS
jgi:hypothetical protein